jgi:hypothetical protein
MSLHDVSDVADYAKKCTFLSINLYTKKWIDQELFG